MKKYLYDYAVIGGDMRNTYTAGLLAAKGYRVISYMLPDEEMQTGFDRADCLKTAVSNAKNIFGPIPLFMQDGRIRHIKSALDMNAEQLLVLLTEEQKLFGGCISDVFIDACSMKGVQCFDYMEDEDVAIYNGIATAEGLIAEMIRDYPGNLHGSRILITGYGRCARILADRLHGLQAKVTICARKSQQRTWAYTSGYKAVDFTDLPDCIRKYDLIVNTVPHLCIDRELLKLFRREMMIFDIASAPGGVDFDEADKLGVYARILPGLPGIYAPRASAAGLVRFIEEN